MKARIELPWEEPKTAVNIAKFIIAHTYYFLRKIYENKFQNQLIIDYINKFKKHFKKSELTNKFSFDMLNKSYEESSEIIKDIKVNTDSKEDKFYYELKYKQFVNIINEQNPNNINDKIISSLISLINCFSYLEYMYLFLTEYPDKISHYIIKINISFLLIIPNQTSKRLINSGEYFYLNLIELKERFAEIKFAPSQFIKQLIEYFYDEYSTIINKMKIKKLNSLKYEISNLCETLIKLKNPKIPYLLDYIDSINQNLKNDINLGKDIDRLIKKYIEEVENIEKKNLKEILNDIDEKKVNIPRFNYLYLISLNYYDELNLKDKIEKNINNEYENKIINDNFQPCQINNINSFNNKSREELNNYQVQDELKKEINKDEFKNTIKEEDFNINKKTNEFDEKKINKIIQIEELILEKKEIEDKLISSLTIEKLPEMNNKYQVLEYFKFLYHKIFEIDKNNIFEILLALTSYNNMEVGGRDIDTIYINNKNDFIEKVHNRYYIDYKYFYDLISDKDFYEEIMKILNSKSFRDYVENKRYYEEINVLKQNKQNEYDFKFCNNGEPYIENFSKEYKIFMEKMQNPSFFANLFRLKYLPYGIRGITDSNLKIITNSLYYKFNDDINEENKKTIFRAVFKVLIVHEVMHILKYLKKEANFGNEPHTPRNREGGKMLINYLFGKPIIKSIDLNEARKINDINNWKNVERLRSIFSNEANIPKEDDEKIRVNKDFIDLLFTGEELNDEEDSNDNINIGIDID